MTHATRVERFIVLLVAVQFIACQVFGFYIIKDHDTLSQIAERHMGRPVYSANGSLAKVLLLNPQIRDPHRIKPGQKIYLSEENRLAEAAPPPRILAEEPPASTSSVRSILSFNYGFEFERIDAKDKSTEVRSTFLSEMNSKVGFKWQVDLDKISPFISFGQVYEKLATDADANVTLDNSSLKKRSMSIGAVYRFSERLAMQTELSRDQRLFVRALSLTNLRFDAVDANSLKLGLQWGLLQRENLSFGLLGGVQYITSRKSGSYDLESGRGFEAGMFLKHSLKRMDLEFLGQASLARARQDSIYAEQSFSSLGCIFGVAKGFQ